MNGTPDIVDAVRSYPVHAGGNGCESGIEALYQTATGEGIAWEGGATPPKRCEAVLDEPGSRRGYPCFRPGALPIIVYVSDAPFYTPFPVGWETDPVFDVLCNNDDVDTAHAYGDAVAALLGIGARVLSLSTAEADPGWFYPSTDHMCRLATDTGAVPASGAGSRPACLGPHRPNWGFERTRLPRLANRDRVRVRVRVRG